MEPVPTNINRSNFASGLSSLPFSQRFGVHVAGVVRVEVGRPVDSAVGFQVRALVYTLLHPAKSH